jgi:hypothetical protein
VPRPGTDGGDGPSRPESALARAERHRGLSVLALVCPLLVVAGRDFAETRGGPVAECYGGELLTFPDLGHLELVRDPVAVTVVATWVRGRLDGGRIAP